MILSTFLIAILVSCGPAYHLRKAKEHILKAEQKGASVKSDTVYKNVDVIRDKLKTDTILRYRTLRDTIRIETPERIKFQLKVDTVKKEIFTSVECPPDTVRIRVPTQINQKIKAGFTVWQLIGTAVASVLFAWMIYALFIRKRY